MLASILIMASMLSASAAPDTLDVATVSANIQAEAAASSPVQRLTNEELRRSGSVYLSEAVRTLSGVSIKDYGGIGGLKTVTAKQMMAEKPELAMQIAVKGMLPKNSIGDKSITRLKVYAGAEHEQQAQKPVAYEVK